MILRELHQRERSETLTKSSYSSAASLRLANKPGPQEVYLHMAKDDLLDKGNLELAPALRSWIENVIVPALVKEYLAELRKC